MEEIGRRLQAARLAKALTLQVAEDETRIRKKYIEALESGRIADIPGEVYVKGFLRTYANYLGLNGEALVEEFKQTRAVPEPDPSQPDQGRATRPAASVMPERPQPRRERPSLASERPAQPSEGREAAPERSGESKLPRRPATGARPRNGAGAKPAEPYLLRRVVVVLLVVLPLAGLVWWGLGKLSSKSPEALPTVQKPQPAVTKPPDPAPQPPPAPPKPTISMTGPKGENVSFDISVSPVTVRMEGFREGFPWMQVWVDGKEQLNGYPSGPVEYSGKEVIIRVGFTFGVDLVVNGEKFVEPLKGGPYTITFTGK